MKYNDAKTRDEIRMAMQGALAKNDTEAFAKAMDDMFQCIGEEIRQEYDDKIKQLEGEADSKILASRGVRQLTSTERKYYQKLGEAMKATDVKQALTDPELVMPETIVDAVFDELATSHPLLSKITFLHTGGAIKMLLNTNGYQEAQWGLLSDAIIKELMAGFKEIDTGLLKLTAFMPVCKAMLELGPEWLDRFVRQVLYEAIANGTEAGIVKGDGKESPIGMIRQVGKGVTVTDGVYPKKAKIKVTNLDADTMGNLLAMLAVDGNGKPRVVEDVILVVNPQDYFKKVFPATTVMAPDGTFRNDVLPYPAEIIQSVPLEPGEAVLGLAKRYFAAAGMGKEGKIEYSDHAQFLQDNRVYMTKLYANGFPMDDNAFLYLDISELKPKTYKVEMVSEDTPSADATLAGLKIGGLTLDPAFSAETTAYTVATTNATNTIVAIPGEGGAEIAITVNDEAVENGAAATWKDGENTVKITVTADDDSTEKVYTVTVTKS